MSYTNTTRLLGINSGLDTASLVTKLMNAESMKLHRHKRNATMLTWKQEAYRETHSKLVSFQKKHLDVLAKNSIRYSATFNAKVTTIKGSDGKESDAVTIGKDMPTGKYTIKVDQLATTDVYESAEKIGREIKTSTDKAFNVADVLEGDSYKITMDKTAKTISLKEGDAVTVTIGDNKVTGTLAFTDTGDIAIQKSDGTIQALDNDQFVEVLNGKLKDTFGMEASSSSSQAKQKVEVKLNNDGQITFFTNGYHDLKIEDGNEQDSLDAFGITSGATAQFDTNRTLGDIFGSALSSTGSFAINGKEFKFTADTKLEDLIDEVNKADIGVNLKYDSVNSMFRMESTETGVANKISMSGEFLTKNLAFDSDKGHKAATDAIATISNGKDTVTVTRTTNQFDVFGVDWTVNKTTPDTITVSHDKDVDSVVEAIKGFVDSYNELILGLNSSINSVRAKSESRSYYEPLLEEEKEEMTESQITKWEGLAKQGILSRDSILTNLTGQMRSMLYKSVEMEDGSRLSLYEIGIATSSEWRDSGKLVIDEDKLRQAITERGDDVKTLFIRKPPNVTAEELKKDSSLDGYGIGDRMNILLERSYTAISEKAGIVGRASDTDNLITKQLDDENKRISSLLTYLADKENYYYNMFAKMEAAMSQSNSQMQYLQSLVG